ncbi:PAS domain S-box protein [Marivirga salinae]|uniref:histidine kinase n=1 Tax=Marivirga salinarum TaxID=3059078 RepID=A0AA49GD13_9BACT|nr:PAS domain S-box protein [Marivirga sp. BDSF4-3]WKK74113.2 PAS domain S-box protein [Marivirga sp. BDSF4-3]
MDGLKQQLYFCIKESHLLFNLINDYAVDGYCFWKVGQHNQLFLDKKFAGKLCINSNDEINLDQLNDQNREYLKAIITELEFNKHKGELQQEIFHTKLELRREKVSIHYSIFNLNENEGNFILASLEIKNDFYRSIEKVSDVLDFAIWQWNLKTNELIVNEKWANIAGYTLKELEPVTVETFINLTHPDDGESTLELAKKYLSGEINEYKTEIRFKHKNGSWRWVTASGKIASRTESGEVEWFIGYHLDITDKKIHEHELDTLALVPKNTLYPVLITDRNGKIIFANNSFHKMSGYLAEDIIGKNPSEFLHGPNTNEEDKISFKRKLDSGKSFIQEILNYTKSGNPYIVSCFVDPVYGNNGEIKRYISIQTDVTQERKNQEYLTNLKNTLDQIKDSIFIYDKDSLQFNYVNQGAIKTLGYSEQELLQLHPYDINPELTEESMRELAVSFEKGENSNLRLKTTHLSKNGKEIPVEVLVQYIRNESIGNHFVAIAKDISSQIATENQLKRLSLVAEKTTNLVVITDDKGRIEYVNSAFEQKTGYKLEEVLGGKPGKFLHGKETNPLHIKANRAGLKTLKPFTQEILNYSKSGKKYWVSITFNPVFNEAGELTNFIAIESDITERIQREDLLKESEERLQFVLKGSELGYWDWDANSGKMTVNDRWFEMLGYTRNDFEVSIDNWHSLVHPEDMEKLNDIMENVFPDPKKSDFYVELRAKHKKGHYIWILDRGSVVERDFKGNPSRISGMHMEITERKELENRLEIERKFLNKILNTNALNLMVLNNAGKIIFVSKGTEKILGLKKNEIEQKTYNDPIWDLYTMDGKPFPSKELPFVKVNQTQDVVKDVQLCLVWKNGTVKYLSLQGSPMSYDNGKVNEVVITILDITQRIIAQKQLDQTKNQMQSILKEMDDVVWSVSIPEYKMIYITPSIEKITGFPQSYYLENYVGNRWEERIYENDKKLLEKAYQDLDEKGSFELEYRIRSKDDRLKWVLNKGTIIKKNGKPSRLDGYITDISKRKEQENALKKYLAIVEDQNERLKNFTYIVSHNLRSHSANIQGLMYLINKKNPEIAENEYVKLLNVASDKLDDTLHHLNNVVSVVSSADEMHKINLSDAITAFSDTFENFIKESKIWFLNEVSKAVYVEAVPAFLESIITNLLNNAIKYKDPEKNDAYVRISSRKFNGIVIIEIEDNGLGIDLEKYGEKLFGMYKTFHNHKDSRGLGLFLTKNQIESMGGKIEVVSKLGIGSTFKVFLKDGNI